ncbi:MAG: ABC transporter ATP-binding protein [Clostridia bacterium]|nr:ABC transporter ATP-binding protein [Clostridia bacterium]
MVILRTENLIKDFNTGEVPLRVLRGVNLEINEGEFVAIMGPSGSGKSTLLYLLGGLDQASGGNIFLGGRDISTLNDMEISKVRRREMGFIFQFYNLIPVLDVEENIMMPINLDGQRILDYTDRLNRIINLVGLGERRHHRPSQLSGGQQQRVAIARALINEPKLILADEPTGNLDSKTSEEILSLLRRLCDEEGRTVVMVTHDPKAAEHADRVIFIKDGEIEKEKINLRVKAIV